MRVFVTDVSQIAEKELARLYDSLPPFRKESAKRCQKSNYPQHVVGFCLVRYAIRHIEPHADTAHWIIGERGKPRLAAGPFFSLSHTESAVAVAIALTEEVGVDLEAVSPRPAGFAARYFSDAEQAAVAAAADPASELIRIWTAKEAEGKRLGSGLSAGIREIATAHTRSLPLTVGEKPHWLSVSPADTPPEVVWVDPAEL